MASDGLDVSYNSRIVGLGGHGVMDQIVVLAQCSPGLNSKCFYSHGFNRYMVVEKKWSQF